MKIVIIGAGSRVFGRGQVVDILTEECLKGKDLELWLVDLNGQALEQMHELAEKINKQCNSRASIHATQDRAKALPGADYVLVAVAVKRMELWEQDFRICQAFGFPVSLGENGGPAGIFHTLRNVELIMPICKDIETYCPNALLLNFTNPEARILNFIQTLSKVKAFGLCHGVFQTIDLIEKTLEMPESELEIVSAGMNHFFDILVLKSRSTGDDLRREFVNRILAAPVGAHPPLFCKMMEAFGMITIPSDDHIGEYLAYGDEYENGWHYGIEQVDLANPQTERTLDMDETHLVGSGEIAVPIICDIEFDRKQTRPAVNALNHDGFIENVPRFGAVEVPAMVDKDGVHPLKVGPVGDYLASIMTTHFTIHKLLIEAYVSKSKSPLKAALLLDPVTSNIAKAEGVLEHFLKVQQGFLGEYK